MVHDGGVRAFARLIVHRYFLDCPEGEDSPFAEPITTALAQLPSSEDQESIVSISSMKRSAAI